METVVRWVLLTVAVALTVQTARPHFRYGNWLDASWTFEIVGVPIPFGMGATYNYSLIRCVRQT
jgi:hypothetical protein